MPFRYDPILESSFGRSIGESIQRGGDIRARQAELVGQAQARAAELSGQAWSGAVGTIGQIAGALPEQLAAQRRQGVADQMNALRLGEMQQQVSGQRAVDTMARGDQLPPGDAGPRQESYLTPDGLFDIPKMNKALASGGLAHMAPDLLKGAEGINNSITQHQALEEKAAQAHTVMLGDLADGARKLATMGMPVADAMDFVTQPALATKRIKPEEYAQVRGQIAQLPPEQQDAVLTNLMDSAAKLGGGKTLGKDAQEVDRYGRTVATNAVPDKKPDYTINGQRFDGATGIAIGDTVPTQTQPKSLESKNVLLDGKPAIVNFNPTSGAHTLPSGEDVSARVRPIPPASTQVNVGQQSDVKETVQGMKDGTIPPQLPGRASKEYTAIMAEAHRQGYDLATAAGDWTATQKHLATLNGAQQTRLRQAISTATDSLDVIDDLAKQWDGGKFPILNKANLALAKAGALGSKAQQIATNLTAQITDVTSELGNVYMGGNSPTDHALMLASKNLSADWTRDQLLSATQLVRKNLQIRSNSITNAGAITATSQQEPPPVVPPKTPALKEGTEGTVSGRAAVWKTVNGVTGWYAK